MRVTNKGTQRVLRIWKIKNTFELGYDVMKGTEYFVSLQSNVVITEEYNVMVNSEELIGTTECVTL